MSSMGEYMNGGFEMNESTLGLIILMMIFTVWVWVWMMVHGVYNDKPVFLWVGVVGIALSIIIPFSVGLILPHYGVIKIVKE